MISETLILSEGEWFLNSMHIFTFILFGSCGLVMAPTLNYKVRLFGITIYFTLRGSSCMFEE